MPMDSASGVAAFAALQGALARRGDASPMEQARIDALAVRYEAEPPADRASLDQAYANAMRVVALLYGVRELRQGVRPLEPRKRRQLQIEQREQRCIVCVDRDANAERLKKAAGHSRAPAWLLPGIVDAPA